jgi:acyl-CoA synthetase (AMP-forming)/AMP-acid ligase II/peptidoglycan/LPS O-acetylase OafA/YrhL
VTTLPMRSLDLSLLGGAPDAVALRSAGESVTYAELARRVADESTALGSTRRLVLLELRNDVASVVRLLAALAGHHPVVLLGADEGDRHEEIARRYAGTTDLHPDLALLLSTSGSTGSPKLVRLSRANLLANARSIADYLHLGPEDRAITSLPLHYSYGLSVLTSHLVAGGTVVLTDLSVADECFWDLARDSRATSFAGVPYTFDLLDSSGFDERDLPDLRYVTQAGGQMAPEQVRRYAELGVQRGWDLVVMYGQTEATARMAYLPPYLASSRPEAIGIPVPGGHFRLDPVPGAEAGEGQLVYSGPNVMMGYAESPQDLARGAELTELHTGDLARQADDGLWEVRGRLDRTAKLFGLRLDLARLERAAPAPVVLLAAQGALHGFVTVPRRARAVRAALVEATGLPAGAVRIHEVDEIPTTGRGKTDLEALRRQVEAAHAVTEHRDVRASPEGLRDLYAVVLGRPGAHPDDSFVSLSGDSLSFVEISTQLERRLGHLPRGWQHLSCRELAATARGRRRGITSLELPVLLRAAAVLAIVISHTDLFLVVGGAHVLLGVAGYNLARFTLATAGRRERSRRVLAAAAAVALPGSIWIATVGLLTGDYRLRTAFYLNDLLGSSEWSLDWQFWFLEVIVWSWLAVAVLLAVPALDRWQRARPFAAALVVVTACLVLRYLHVGLTAESTERYSFAAVLWCLALGWAAAEARSSGQRLLVVMITAVGTCGFFVDDLQRQVVVAVGISLLVLGRSVPVPTAPARVLQHVAAASFWIYLTHWQVYPDLEAAGHQVWAILASVAVGLVAHAGYRGLCATSANLINVVAFRTRSRPVAPSGPAGPAAWSTGRRGGRPPATPGPGAGGAGRVSPARRESGRGPGRCART